MSNGWKGDLNVHMDRIEWTLFEGRNGDGGKNINDGDVDFSQIFLHWHYSSWIIKIHI